jgi:hypothetical protein
VNYLKKLVKPIKEEAIIYSCYLNESATANTVITVGVTVGASVTAAVITMGDNKPVTM